MHTKDLISPTELKIIKEINFSTPYPVKIYVSPELTPSLSFTFDAFEIFSFDVKQKGRSLNVSFKKKLDIDPENNYICLNMPSLSKITSFSNATILGSIVANNFTIERKVKGDIKLYTNVEHLTLDIRGSGDIIIEGNVDKLDLTCVGSNNLYLNGLITEIANINSSNTLDTHLFSNKYVDIKNEGLGKFHIEGPGNINILHNYSQSINKIKHINKTKSSHPNKEYNKVMDIDSLLHYYEKEFSPHAINQMKLLSHFHVEKIFASKENELLNDHQEEVSVKNTLKEKFKSIL